MKVKIHYKGYTRTFYTRRDWKNGKKLYYKAPYSGPRMTGNWYNDPHYGYMSWQDYEREYALQQRGISVNEPAEVTQMRYLVDEYNDYLIELMQMGLTEYNLNHVKEAYERHCILKDIYKIMEEKYGYKVLRDDIINALDIRTFEEVVDDNISYYKIRCPEGFLDKDAIVASDEDYTPVGNQYWKNAFWLEDEEDLDLLKDGYIEKI